MTIQSGVNKIIRILLLPIKYAYSTVCHLFHKEIKNNKVLIYAGGALGDAVMYASCISKLVDTYSKDGKSVEITGTRPVLEILDIMIGLNKKKNITILDEMSDKTVLNVLKSLKFDVLAKYETITAISIGGTVLSDIACIHTNNRYALIQSHNLVGLKGRLSRLFLSFYNEVETVESDYHFMKYVENLLKKVGIADYRSYIYPTPVQCAVQKYKKPYILVSIDSSKTEKRWPAANFVRLINWLLSRYHYDIVLTGTNMTSEETVAYDYLVKSTDRIHSSLGRLEMSEWVEMIRKSRFLIGVDSAPVHIAASVGTTAFCLVGAWHGVRFFPYQMSAPEGTKKPILIMRKDFSPKHLPCYNCWGKKRIGWGNQGCLKRCRAGLPCLCLEKITVDDVICAIQDAESHGFI